ncbi:dihydrofolate reductase [Bacillus phage PK2]|nr:dihydrofolate reductase [Bacillus phage PK2]
MGRIILIVAHDGARGIGKDNKLPWKLPEDMRHFKRTTMGHTVVMGRNTFESIGSKGLVGRSNIVLSRTLPLLQENAIVVRHFSILLQKLQNSPSDAYIIGGEQIYREFLKHADEVIVTEIDGVWECDAHFPKLTLSNWERTDSLRGEKCWFHYFKRRKSE